jgi:hypothetical protein
MKTKLQLNPNKVRDNQPLLIGLIECEGPRRVALWNHIGKNGSDEYYSGKLTTGEKDTEPVSLKTLSEFKQAAPGDPDFYTRESVTLGEEQYNGYLWLGLDADGEPEFVFELTTECRSQKLSDEVIKFRDRIKQRLSAKAAATPALLTHTDPDNVDEIPF